MTLTNFGQQKPAVKFIFACEIYAKADTYLKNTTLSTIFEDKRVLQFLQTVSTVCKNSQTLFSRGVNLNITYCNLNDPNRQNVDMKISIEINWAMLGNHLIFGK